MGDMLGRRSGDDDDDDAPGGVACCGDPADVKACGE